MINDSKEELIALLAPYGQEHLLRYWEELNEEERAHLAGQIASIDWADVSVWIHNALSSSGSTGVDFSRLTVAPYVELHPEDAAAQASLAEAKKYGERLLRDGKVGCFTVAGGQGTRLGYDGPKGTYAFSLIEQKSLFEYFADSIARNNEKYGVRLQWYIMTSPANNADTVSFFRDHGFFGLHEADIHFFIQGTLPGFSTDGKALLASKSSLALFANGHGGTLAALRSSGMLSDMSSRGIEYISYWQVDNPMVSVCDPLFIGLHALRGSEMSSRALIKRDAMEKLGHFCTLDGRTVIIEYSDMPMELLQRRDADGQLTFRPGSPAIHVLSRSFIERITEGRLAFNPHRANKKIECIDDTGAVVKPEKPNGIKLEFFIFDALPLAKNPLILEADRSEQFAAIKNPSGNDSPDSCRGDLLKRTAAWLEQAGVNVPRNAQGDCAAAIEISLRTANCQEDVAALVKAGRIPLEIQSGETLTL